MGGGTEAFPDLGQHCQHPDCYQLDFLPFKCDGCLKVFCLEHRSYRTHECPKSDHINRKVVVCEACSMSIEVTGRDGEGEKEMLERHERSGNCDPKKKKKPTCPVRRCKEKLTFSNTSACKTCQQKVCLKHRFPAEHACGQAQAQACKGSWNDKFLAALASRNGTDCSKNGRGSASATTTSLTVEAH